MKKPLKLISLLIFLTSLTAYSQNVGEQFTVDGITYKITDTTPTEVEIVDYTGIATQVIIPQTVNYQGTYYEVTAISNQAFKEKQLTEITIPNSVTSIRRGAFAYNDLTEVTIPNSVTSIESNAFSYNELTEIVFSTLSNLTSIEGGVFKANKLNSVTIPEGVTTIGNSAFSVNPLVHVTIPGSVITIDQWAFNGAPNSQTIFVEATTPPSIEENTFGHRDQIDVVVPRGNPVGSIKAAYETFWGTDFKSITEVAKVNDEFTTVDHITYKITSIDPNTVTVTDYSITGGSLTIPDTVQYQRIDYAVTVIGHDAFREKGLTEVILPNTVTSIKSHAFAYNELTGVMTLPNSVTSIEVAAFAVNQLDSVTIPSSVTRIPNYAFHRNQLKSVTIPPDVTSIGTHAFQFNQLTEVTLPNNLTSIGNSAFWDNDLTEVTLPVNVTRIDQWAFWDNPNLVKVRAKPDSPPTLDAKAFKDRSRIHVVVPKGKKDAYEQAWGTDFKSITEVVGAGDTFSVDHITYKVTPLAPYEVEVADYTITGGPSVNIPSTVDHGPNTYTVTAIGNEAFKEKGLTNVAIPNTVTNIRASAFQDNELVSVIIPNSVTNIGHWAFAVNPNLGLVTVERNDPPALDIAAFQGLRDQIDVVVPKDAINDYKEPANGWTDFKSITFGSFTSDGFKYGTISSTEVIVLDYTGTATEVTIPQTANDQGTNYTVTAIGNRAFQEKGLTSVIFTGPSNVNNIGNYAFFKNQLTEVNIPNGVISIDGWAFADNQLTSVAIPNSVTSIRDYAFFKNQLTEVNIPGNVTSIDRWAFGVNPNLDTVFVASPSPPTLHEHAFHGSNDTDLRHQIHVILLRGNRQDYLNNKWTGFKSVEEAQVGYTFIDDGIKYLITSLEPYTVMVIGDTGTGEVNIPEIVKGLYTVTAIGANAFFWTRGVTSVTIPSSVTSIGASAFENNALSSVTIPEGVTSIGDYAFFKNRLTEVALPSSVISIGATAFASNQLTEVIIPDNVTSIGKAAFRTNKLTSVTIGNSVISIGDWAFEDNQLTSVTIGTNVISIGDRAFENNRLTEITIPNSVTSIEYGAFGTNRLTSVTIGTNVTSIAESAFADNEDLATVVTKATDPPSLHPIAFQSANRNQIDLIVPSGTKDEYLAAEWTGFKSITEAAMAAQSAVAQRSSAKASAVESAVVPAHSNKGNARNNVTVYPNPTQDYIHIRLSDSEALQQVNLYNTQGVHVYSAYTLQIDISHLPGGMYMLEIETKAGKRVVKRVIVK